MFNPSQSPTAKIILAGTVMGTITEVENVKTDFGAVGDGVNLDSVPILNAVAALPASGGIVFLPKGLYRVGPMPMTKSNVWILGSGPGTHLKADPTLFTPNSSSLFEVNGGVKDVMLTDFLTDGAGTDTNNGISVTGGSEATIERIHSYNWLGVQSQRARGITVKQNPASAAPPYKPTTIGACYFFNCQIGVVVHRCVYVVDRCVFENMAMDGVYVDGIEARGTISNNFVTGAQRTGLYPVYGWRNTIIGNTVQDSAVGISVYQGFGNKIIGNTVERCAQNGIFLTAGAQRNIIADNTVVDFQTSGATGIFLYNASQFNDVVHNEVYRVAGAGIACGSGTLGPSNENQILDNLVADCAIGGVFGGIELRDAQFCTVSRNRCWDDQATKTQDYGVRSTGLADFNKVYDNDLRGNLTAGLVLVGANNIVRDNDGA